MHVYLFGSYSVNSRGVRRWSVGRDGRRCGGESQALLISVDTRITVSYRASGSTRGCCSCIRIDGCIADRRMLPCFPGPIQNYVTTGVSVYEGVAAAGTLAVEHTSVAEILAAVARYSKSTPATPRSLKSVSLRTAMVLMIALTSLFFSNSLLFS